ncbi:MAG: triose-phosphate isomerase [Gammaproteobacteria bacterium]|nr:MAG: triose-phosphate isomerase [Gammaproteobacteria bacterium]
MRRKLVAGNWKMNGSRKNAQALVEAVKQGAARLKHVETVLCPPFVYLSEVGAQLAGSAILLGAQNLCDKTEGAYTGEVAGTMLRDVGCSYVIVGHSERRSLYGETDELVALKVAAALGAGLKPILCLGETLQEREQNITEAVAARQLDAVLKTVGVEGLAQGVVAYEPVWAIGTGRTASPAQAQEVHAYLRRRIAAHNATIAGEIRILYGGSVKADNAAELFAMPDIDGGLIGGASLHAGQFLAICQAAE